MKQLTVVVPTFNEEANIHRLFDLVHAALEGHSWEIMFVDDASTDNTVSAIFALSKKFSNVRIIRRFGRRGLSSACIEGMLASTSEYVAVMDADLQHDERLLPNMLNELTNDHSNDLIVGSRYCKGASLGNLDKSRVTVSQYATKFSKLFYSANLTDPMSGFFMIRSSTLAKIAPHLSGIGYKILLDIVMTGKDSIKLKELPYDMRSRELGESKLDIKVSYEYFLLIADKTIGQYFPLRLLMFLMVGTTGVILHLFFMWLFHVAFSLEFVTATVSATYLAMTSNFLLNNQFTYKDKKLKGRYLIGGYFSFVIACSMGAIVNISIANLTFENLNIWWIASLLGAVVGSVWNYTMSNILTWRTK